MPSISDVYNQLVTANATLDELHTDLGAEKTAIDQVATSVTKLDTDVITGFQTTATDLATLIQLNAESVSLLYHLTQQADTMICALENISRNTCNILNEATQQTRLQARIRDDADVLRDIIESANPAAALARNRLAELHAEVEKCCPHPTPPPACTYQPCPKPEPAPAPQPPPQPPRIP
jgi:hypothetical protein